MLHAVFVELAVDGEEEPCLLTFHGVADDLTVHVIPAGECVLVVLGEHESGCGQVAG